MGLFLSAIQLPRGPFFANEIGVVGTRHRRFLSGDGRYFRSTSRPKTPLWASWHGFLTAPTSGGGKRAVVVLWLGRFPALPRERLP